MYNIFEHVKQKNIMKKIKFLKRNMPLVILGLLLSIGITSCSKDDDNSNSEITEEEAVEVIESSLAKETNGASKTVETAVETADEQMLFTEEPTIECGQTYSDSYNESFTGATYSYDYAVSRDYLLSCGILNKPESLSYSLEFNGVYDTVRMSSNDTTTVDWVISNLLSMENPAFNGSYLREGTQVSKVRNMNTFTSTLSITMNNLTVDKNTYVILSGTAQVSFVGTSSSGGQYTFNGSLTFNGDETATLIINGNTYTINL